MMNARKFAIRWRAPRNGRVRRKPFLSPHLRLVAPVAAVEPEEEPPPTLRDPSLVVQHAVFDALCVSVEVLAAELDVVVDAGDSARIYRDPSLAAHLLSPFVARMPPRDGLIPIGTVRVAGRRVRIYEKAA